MSSEGLFKGWLPQRPYGFIGMADGSPDVFLSMSKLADPFDVRSGTRLSFEIQDGPKGRSATTINILEQPNFELKMPNHGRTAVAQTSEQPSIVDEVFESEEVEDLDTNGVTDSLITEISRWKRDARVENSSRYFWHVREVDSISHGEKCYVIGRKGSGKTAICEHFNAIRQHDSFAEKLSFKNFQFNELYEHKNDKYTNPNQFITIWKYLIYSTTCRLILKNQEVDEGVRLQLFKLYDDKTSLNRRVGRWVSKEFGFSLFGLSLKVARSESSPSSPDWVSYVDYLEDILLQHAGSSTYYILFDELDEDYRDIIARGQHDQYQQLITSLFKAVQDIRSIFGGENSIRLFPVVFLRDDIYDLIQDSDKNKWGDFRVDLNWDAEKIRRLIAFRISRAIDPNCIEVLPFDVAWSKIFGSRPIGVGTNREKTRISTFEFICRSTLIRPRDFVLYMQSCAQYAIDANVRIDPYIVRSVDKAFSNYLRQELTDEIFALLPDIVNILDTMSQLRKWNFSIPEFERAYNSRVEQGFIQERNVKFVLQVLYLFSVIGNMPRPGRYVFRYLNREARLNFNERVVVHRGLFKALQIL